MRVGLIASVAALAPLAAVAGPIGVAISSSNSGYYGPDISHLTQTRGPSTNVDASGGTGNSLYSIHFNQQTVTTADGGFLFTTSINAKGNVTSYNDTTLTLTITNNGNGPEHLRFDSQILPGHIGSQNIRRHTSSVNFGEYLFNVKLGSEFIYTNYGEVRNGVSTITGFTSLNGSTPVSIADEAQVAYAADWGATNIDLDLGTFAAGETKTLSYEQTLYNNITSDCTDLANCSGVSLTFGDPRRSGGVVGAAAVTGAPGSSLIDFKVNPFLSYLHVVDFSAPLPPQPRAPIIPNYNPPSPVPEPATLALFGVGAFGIALARRARAAR